MPILIQSIDSKPVKEPLFNITKLGACAPSFFILKP